MDNLETKNKIFEGLENSQNYIEIEEKYGAHNYHSIPVVLKKGSGCNVWDVEDKLYFDFLAGFSAVNPGHCHPRLINTLIEQSQMLTLSSRAFHNNMLGPYSRFITKMFGYDKILPMNTGVEAGETAVKLCRKWGYYKKHIADNKAKIIMCNNNFWGRTISACSSSSDPSCYKGYGPYTGGFELIDYNSITALQNALNDPDVAGFYVEPIQGEGGVIVPDDGYIKKAFDLCKSKNVLFIADEIQTGLGRCGSLLACDYDGVHPDILILGKALSGGILPSSAVLANDDIMLCIEPGTHGSTFGGNPLACSICLTALNIIIDEKLCENSYNMGLIFRAALKDMNISWIKKIRGRGLFNAIEVDSNKVDPWELSLHIAKFGVLTKPTHDNILRFSPPLIITQAQLNQAILQIKEAFQTIPLKQ